jgi:HAD superfamily phosphoserine phosphatase-like hydrolase
MTMEPMTGGLAYGLRTERDPGLVPDFLRDIEQGDGRSVAVYDADGTMWRDDVADDFTCFMIDTKEISGARWAEYMRIYRDDGPAGCRFLLSLYEGMSIERLHERIDHWWLHHARRIWIPEVVESIHWMRERGYPIWVVSGTPTDFLLPLTRMLPVERVLGMDFEIEGGVVTGRLAGISCAAEGKAEKLMDEIQEGRVALCAGNGSLDAAMMRIARIAWSVYPNPEFEGYSKQRGWPVLSRPSDFVEEQKFKG